MPDSLQSPIDIAGPLTRDDLPPLDFRYPDAVAATAEFRVASGDPLDGRPRAIVQVVVTPPPGAAELRVDGRAYELTSLHWHTPAEHAIDGRRPPMELHLVHADADGGILVVGVLYSDGPAQPRASPPSSTASPPSATPPPSPCPPSTSPAFWWICRSLGRRCRRPGCSRRASYRYQGSLTTADDDGVFRDGVQWVVMREPVAAAAAQLDAHRALVDAPLPDLDRPNPPGNARDLQPRAGREILTDD